MPAKNRSAKKAKKSGGWRSNKLLPAVSTTPPSRRILMTYSTSISLTESAAGNGATYFYRLNSVYDPDSSGVGASAIGYSTWSALYLNYKVSRVTARIQGTAVCASGGFVNVIMAPVPFQAVVPANKQTWKLIPGSMFRATPPNANGGPTIVNMSRSYDLARVARVSKRQYDVDMDWSGQVGSNPARQTYLLIAIDSVGSGTVGSFSYNIQLTYQVEWFNPVPMQ